MTIARSIGRPVRFTLEDAQRASDEWGANCGPGAIAAICGMTLDELRPHLGDFESKRYTNPKLMFETLGRLQPILGFSLNIRSTGALQWPRFGLARIQWEGPWTAPGVPVPARYRHTHWVGCSSDPDFPSKPGTEEPNIFDINAMCVGGWIPLSEWSESLVPWLLKECEPNANGKWHLTHVIEVFLPGGAA